MYHFRSQAPLSAVQLYMFFIVDAWDNANVQKHWHTSAQTACFYVSVRGENRAPPGALESVLGGRAVAARGGDQTFRKFA